ncbi:MAG: hypothetical protein V4504_01300 [Patescibacteria group bacterium]
MDQTKKSNGALIGSIIIIIILIIGGIYVFKMNIQKNKDAQEMNADMQQANNLSSSDEASDLEIDLQNNSNIDAIDKNYQ